MGMTGLAIASDLGILAQTAVARHSFSIASGSSRFTHLEFTELARALFAALLAYAADAAAHALVHALPPPHCRKGDLLIIAAGSTAWVIVAFGILCPTKSKLPDQNPPPQILTPSLLRLGFFAHSLCACASSHRPQKLFTSKNSITASL